MKEFTKWLTEMDEKQPDGMPPVNGGVTPSLPPEVASELSAIAQKLNDLLTKLGIGDKSKGPGDQNMSDPKPDKGLADKGTGDPSMNNKTPGPPPNFQT